VKLPAFEFGNNSLDGGRRQEVALLWWVQWSKPNNRTKCDFLMILDSIGSPSFNVAIIGNLDGALSTERESQVFIFLWWLFKTSYIKGYLSGFDCVWMFVNLILNQHNFAKLILRKHEFVVMWFCLDNTLKNWFGHIKLFENFPSKLILGV